MLRIMVIFLALIQSVSALGGTPKSLQKVRVTEPLYIGPAQEQMLMESGNIPSPASPRHHLDEPIGLIDTAGTTYQDWQHNGTAGKMLGIDGEGFAHIAWTKAEDPSYTTRHVQYNVWDPSIEDFIFTSIGIRVDVANRGGFVTSVVDNNGFCFPAFHQITTTALAHSAGAIDYAAYADGFTSWEVPYLYEGSNALQIIFPHVAMDIHGDLHTVSYEYEGQNRIYYAKGQPVFDEFGFGLEVVWGEFQLIDSLNFMTQDMAASRHSERIAMAYVDDKAGDLGGNNVYIVVSEDAGANWGPPINITNFTPPDTACFNSGGDINTCNKDTLRPWLDLSIIFDENDYVHLAWTSRAWLYWSETGEVGPWTYYFASQIYHWGEDRNEFNIVADAWYGNNGSPESNSTNCDRPSLAIDPTNNYLYCSYQLFDTVQYSENIFPMADAWVTVSTNNGRTWAEATNVTRTDGGVGTPAPGSLSERDITLAPLVSDGLLHMEYTLDLDAGCSVFGGGIPTLNPVIYQRIPVDSIPISPIIDPCRNLRVDSTGYPWELCGGGAAEETHLLPPGDFRLYPNYPNPFNPLTTIQFDLARSLVVTLKVYNLLGQEVASLLSEMPLQAGVHKVDFDASDLPSGVYIYRLTTANLAASRKMILLK